MLSFLVVKSLVFIINKNQHTKDALILLAKYVDVSCFPKREVQWEERPLWRVRSAVFLREAAFPVCDIFVQQKHYTYVRGDVPQIDAKAFIQPSYTLVPGENKLRATTHLTRSTWSNGMLKQLGKCWTNGISNISPTQNAAALQQLVSECSSTVSNISAM